MFKKKLFLHIGAGKINLMNLKKDKNNGFNVYLDRSYQSKYSIEDIENFMIKWVEGDNKLLGNHFAISDDIFHFMDTFKFKFNHIEAYRIFEHMEYCSGEIGRLLEACNMLSTEDAELNIIVPNAILLSKLLLHYEKDFKKYNSIESLNTKLIINSEFCNIKCDPHGSIWTPRLAQEYIDSEGTWFISGYQPHQNYANRDIYMLINCMKKEKKGGSL